ncbi:hypothetical protein CP967_22120 [Streptomyces nitrosporeus]|uniref:DNA primase/polymerase bifunctional N-terminal domain-containing protein n=1 Tax=Streptomyces nitrosporeus TaxID=28894 RepID=A0A5J6FHG1_9ACTN|nr:hypothetical protein [Streptomyces nitrosporeus]QEU74330.1 hypothetical protein CP967_22120 [Streptomyces nitrosporeus]GGY96383.1 hypothetical protein GCM10010327_28640 [Streptomyces nitrosporeus]
MSAWLKDETTLHTGAAPHHGVDLLALLRDGGRDRAAQVTAAGAAWLAGASAHPRSTLARWEAHPSVPGVLPCGSSFDVVNLPALFGRRVLEQLWSEGPGSGPAASHRGRVLLFAAPGTAQRLPTLLAWEEWGTTGGAGRVSAATTKGAAAVRDASPDTPARVVPRTAALPALLCHGTGDAVTVPPLAPRPGAGDEPRWLVAPDTRAPWLPGPDVLLWACVRAGRAAAPATTGHSIFPPADPGANVYDVSRRR